MIHTEGDVLIAATRAGGPVKVAKALRPQGRNKYNSAPCERGNSRFAVPSLAFCFQLQRLRGRYAAAGFVVCLRVCIWKTGRRPTLGWGSTGVTNSSWPGSRVARTTGSRTGERFAPSCAFQRSDYLYGSRWDLFFAERDVIALIKSKVSIRRATGTDDHFLCVGIPSVWFRAVRG